MATKQLLGCALLVVLCVTAPLAAGERQPAELVVLARLADAGTPGLGCGVLHLAVVMRYEVIKIVSGHQEGRTLYVVHGCPELPRTVYRRDAGTVAAFKVGDVHRLSLATRGAPFLDGEAIDALASEKGRRYWALRADRAEGEEPQNNQVQRTAPGKMERRR
jgi:hypothetical protein